MLDPKQFDEMAKKLFSALPESVQNMEQDLQQKFKDILQATFARLDLVTREEFDVQTKVLARTREKLDALQLEVDALMQEKKEKQEKKTK